MFGHENISDVLKRKRKIASSLKFNEKIRLKNEAFFYENVSSDPTDVQSTVIIRRCDLFAKLLAKGLHFVSILERAYGKARKKIDNDFNSEIYNLHI